MKTALLIPIIFFNTSSLWAQSDLAKYPDPEFTNEVCYLKKDNINTTVRLEKNISKLDSKTKGGGLGGYESGYAIEGTKSAIRLPSNNNLTFVFSTGVSSKTTSSKSDSIMKANEMDPGVMQSMTGSINNSPDNIILYKCESGSGKRKILMKKSGGAFSLNKKIRSSEKYTFSIKKIREGYSELVIDKNLPAGEYAFSVPQNGMGGMGGDVVLFAFGID